MYRTILILIICGLGPTYLSAQGLHIEELEHSYIQKDWSSFADNFPETFSDFMEIYGYDINKGAKPLYYVAFEHISFLFSDERIMEDKYLDKLLILTEGYYWDADATSYLGKGIEDIIKGEPEMIAEYMIDKPDILIKYFLKSAIATPYPEPENTPYYQDYLATKKLYEVISPRIVRLFEMAHQELMEEWVEN